jgi:outer membrane protein
LISGRYLQAGITGIFLIMVLLWVWPSGLNAFDLELDNAISMALKSNEIYLTALQDKLKAEGEITEARSGALPSLTLDGRYTRNFELQELIFAGEKFTIGAKNDYSISLNLDQTLFDGGKVFNAWKIANLYDKYATEGVKIARHSVIYGTKQAFFSVILARDNVNVARDAVSQAQENFKVVNNMYLQGLVSEYDNLRAEVELANLVPQLTKAENDARLALNNLKYYIGYTGLDELDPKFVFSLQDTIATPDLDTSLEQAFARRPDYVGQDYLIRAYKKVIGISRSGRMPSLYFSSALSWNAAVNETFPAKEDWIRSWSATLDLSFPIFDGLKTSGSIKKSKADYVKNNLAKSQLEDAIRLEVEEAISQIEESKKRLASGQRTIAMAEEGQRVANLRFKNGVGTQLEILSAQSALTQAKTNYVLAVYDYQIALAKYDKAIGLDRPGEKE